MHAPLTMGAYDGDLLKQATNTLMTSRDDDNIDHIDSDTPRSGVATPQPDPSDKRLPGINHSYFTQVGLSSSKSQTLGLPVSVMGYMTPPEDGQAGQAEKLLPVAPALDEVAHTSSSSKATSAQAGVLTPPISKPPSLHKQSPEGVESAPSGRESFSVPLPIDRADGASGARKASIKSPLTSVVTASTVHAVHFSKPGGGVADQPAGSSSDSSSDPFFSESAVDELKRLTLEDEKSIPPTPTRALSNNTSKSDGSNTSDPTNGKYSDSTGALPHTGAPVTPARGKLTVRIAEARGLRRSKDPYVVAVFQRNELVSKGPRNLGEEDNGDMTVPMGGIPIMKSPSDQGRPMAIPMKSRQSSNTSLSEKREAKPTGRRSLTNPIWDTEAVFDVVSSDALVSLTVYDRASATEDFLGYMGLEASLNENDRTVQGWFPLRGRNDSDPSVVGELHVEVIFQRTEKKHYGPEDFQILKLIGKGTFGQVYQVRKKDTKRIYAMKVLQKKVIVQKKEVAHTVGERNILVRTAMTESPFIVGLKFSFQTPTDLYLVTDFMSGGELFWHLQKEGRFDERRAKFYIAELILALQHLHMHDIVYRDLKPENILLDANGHIALCDFGLSKANLTKNATTNTFCGTTEYLAPEVLLDEAGYTKMVDFWSLGVLVFEMCCGWSPFYAEDTQQMYKNIAFGKVRFPRDTLTTEGRNFVKGLLNRNPKHRLGATDDAEELKRHAFFADINWDDLMKKKITPPFKPKLSSETDTSNFDPEFTNALGGASSLNARAAALAAGQATSTPLSPGMQANFKGFTFVDESSIDEHFQGRTKNDDDDMDEDLRDEDWETQYDNRRADRMSGIQRVSTNEDSSMFNGGEFDI